jgi:hypothetical protein
MTDFTPKQFNDALITFVGGCQDIVTKNDAQYENVKFDSKITVKAGRRYVKLIKSDGFVSTGVYCFVDRTNGNILKAASWKAPAKHARGNIFNNDNGLGAMSPYGAAYLR